ncbi:MAG: S1/P1 nuclease [Flavobacteriaceae bacterium]|jgi:hypothetical protein|nr:S1/P1 nuclease [Flavobacteriaceae bacterium]MDG1962022.1 S1/P1 nuclease [Flavobacteriaceae bacterium]
MSAKIKYILIALVVFSNPAKASDDWGVTGHRTIGAIAQQYLDPEVANEVTELLDGASLAFVSTYADEIRSDDQYDRFVPWHYVNFPFGEDYHSHPKSSKGDIIMAIEKCSEIIKDRSKSKDERAFYLKLLVHFVGDLHQPLHVGIQEDRGGNRFYVKWFGESTNLHSVWDTKLIEGYNMSYSELVTNQDRLTAEEVEQIQLSSVSDWMDESRALCEDIYAHTEPEEKLSYAYSYRYLHTVRGRLQKGGLRLAALLNDLL